MTPIVFTLIMMFAANFIPVEATGNSTDDFLWFLFFGVFTVFYGIVMWGLIRRALLQPLYYPHTTYVRPPTNTTYKKRTVITTTDPGYGVAYISTGFGGTENR